tara:strand:- start:3100 stop:3702 length:603 start_codon:yes stop_codon:yes gene_type:complete
MNTDKLLKAIQIIVESEIKTVLPKLVKAGVKAEMAKLLKENKQLREALRPTKKVVPTQPTFMDEAITEAAHPTQLSTEPIQEQRLLSKNPILNQILNQTQPLSLSENTSKSVLDKMPAYAGAPTEVSDSTLEYGTQSTHTLGAQSIADKMGYGDMQPAGKKQGLGVSTGLAGLDRVLNRDNSELIKAMDKSKGPWRPGMQ